MMEDLNAKVREGCNGDMDGSFGVGDRNVGGDKRVECCQSWEQIIMNTYCRHHPRHLFT